MSRTRLTPQNLASVYIGELILSDGTSEYTRPYSTRGAAKGQATALAGDRDIKDQDGLWLYSPHIENIRILVATQWEEV